MNTGKKIMVIAAHPDDEVLGCGGTIARLSKNDCNVSLIILGEGITSRGKERHSEDIKEKLRLLKEQTKKASKILGIKSIKFCDLPDNRFDTVDLLDIVKIIEKEIIRSKPEIIFTHANSDLNIDHVITHRAVLTATRPFSGRQVREVYAFEVPSSTEWAFGEFGTFKPNVFYDISDTLHTKIEALNIYESEVKKPPHPRSGRVIEALAVRWGSAAGLKYAEAFHLVRALR